VEVQVAISIGELAQRTNVPVRTIRFYCDTGILAPTRSAGGHRKFGPEAVEQLTLIRRLRALGLGLPAITDVLAGNESVASAVAAERAALDVELAALSWRRASLAAVEAATPRQRAERLGLLAAVEDGHAAHDALVRFCQRLFAGAPEHAADAVIAMTAPPPPANPTPVQVVAYAEMVALAGDHSLIRALAARIPVSMPRVGEAFELAEPLVQAGKDPSPGPALDHFVSAYTTIRHLPDTPEFRHHLRSGVGADRDPRLRRYWDLYSAVTGEVITLGTLHFWLLDALTANN
jgi:DNA-binding transcriptional MerR regulator